jgi:hypothetical protein
MPASVSPSNVSPSTSNISPSSNLPFDVIMPSFPAGIAGQTAVQTLTAIFPASWDYWELRFSLTAITLAMIQEMRVIVNSVVRIRVRGGSFWDLRNQYDKVPAYAGTGTKIPLIWYFRRLRLGQGGAQSLGPAAQGQQLPTLFSGTGKDLALLSTLNCGSTDANGVGIGTLSIEFDLVNTSSTAPVITCVALASAVSAGGSGLVPSLELTTPQVSANNLYNFGNANLKFGDNKHLLLNRIYFVPASGTMDSWVVRHNGVQKLIRSTADNAYVENEGGHADQSASGLYILDWSERGYGDEMLPIGAPGTDFQVDAIPSASGNINVFQESEGNL